MPVRLEDLSPALQAEVLRRAEGLGLVVRRRRRGRAGLPPASAVPAEVLGRARLAPAIAAWAWRRHPKCGWEGIGRCVGCGS